MINESTRSAIRFMVIGMQRSGTSVTFDMLYNHPNVSALQGEIFIKPFFDKGLDTFTQGNKCSDLEIEFGHRIIFDAISSFNYNKDTKANGLKCTVNTLSDAKIFRVQSTKINISNLRYIFLIRENLLDQYLSLVRAKITGKWHSFYQSKVNISKTKINFNREDYINYIIDGLYIQQVLIDISKEVDSIIIEYENELCLNMEAVQIKLYEFLNLPFFQVKSRYNKIQNNVKELICEYDELYTLFQSIKIDFNSGTNIDELKRKYLPFRLKRSLLKYMHHSYNYAKGFLG